MWYCSGIVLSSVYLLGLVLCEAHLSDKWDENVRPKMVFSYYDQSLESKALLNLFNKVPVFYCLMKKF